MMLVMKLMVRGVRPPVWRRFRMDDSLSVADLHRAIQVLLGWHDDKRYRFRIQGRYFGAARGGGPGFLEDSAAVRLSRFSFRPSERFLYEYDFIAGWQIEVRVKSRLDGEQSAPVDVPVCIGGREPAAHLGRGGPSNYAPPRIKGPSRQARVDMATVASVLLGFIDGDIERSALREPGTEFEQAFSRMKARLPLASGRFPCAKFNAALQKTFNENRSAE